MQSATGTYWRQYTAEGSSADMAFTLDVTYLGSVSTTTDAAGNVQITVSRTAPYDASLVAAGTALVDDSEMQVPYTTTVAITARP